MRNAQLAPGSLFANRFEIQHAAGSGAMGTVYRAVDRYRGETVDLKLLHVGSVGSDEADRLSPFITGLLVRRTIESLSDDSGPSTLDCRRSVLCGFHRALQTYCVNAARSVDTIGH